MCPAELREEMHGKVFAKTANLEVAGSALIICVANYVHLFASLAFSLHLAVHQSAVKTSHCYDIRVLLVV